MFAHTHNTHEHKTHVGMSICLCICELSIHLQVSMLCFIFFNFKLSALREQNIENVDDQTIVWVHHVYADACLYTSIYKHKHTHTYAMLNICFENLR